MTALHWIADFASRPQPCPWGGRPTRTRSGLASVIDPQSDAAVDGVADRLRPERAVDEEIRGPALGQAEAEPAAIFEPALVAHGWNHGAVAGDGGEDSGMRCEGLHPAAVDVAFDLRADEMRPLAADLDEAGAIGPGRDRGVERIEGRGGIGVAGDALPQLPDFNRGCDLVA